MNTVVCVRWGEKYSADYVNNLYSMVTRNLNDVNFICYGDTSMGLKSGINFRELPANYNLTGWWFKLWLFSREANLTGKILFLDLDVVIINRLEPFFSHSVETICAIRDWLFAKRNITKFNSSVMLFDPEKCYSIWDEFYPNRTKIMAEYSGDQDWIGENAPNITSWPDIWCTSYKYDRQYEHIDPLTKIVVFHGTPNPPEAIIGTSRFPPCPWIATMWR